MVESRTMPSIISSQLTESTLRACLKEEAYDLSVELVNGETGVDVLATKLRKSIHIEVIGFKSSGPARSRDFFQCFFRAVSRIQNGAARCVIALPARWESGLPLRARQYGAAWERIGTAFPELEIWLVDTDEGSYRVTDWNYWLRAVS